MQLRKRYVKTNKEKGDDEKKKDQNPKIRYLVVLVKKLRQRPVVLRFLLTSKRALSYMRIVRSFFFSSGPN